MAEKVGLLTGLESDLKLEKKIRAIRIVMDLSIALIYKKAIKKASHYFD